jgi:hypothetical protein
VAHPSVMGNDQDRAAGGGRSGNGLGIGLHGVVLA